jgi:type VI secretion system protein VasG
MSELKVLIEKLNRSCRHGMEAAAELCVRQTNHNVELEHLLVTLLQASEADFHHILRYYGIDAGEAQAELTAALDRLPRGSARTPALSPHLPRLLERGWLLASLSYDAATVRSGVLLLALLEDETLRGVVHESAPALLRIPREDLRASLPAVLRGSAEGSGGTAKRTGAGRGSAGSPGGGALDRYTVDLTAAAREGRIDPVRGREREVRQVMDILLRRRQNNPILTGDAGVGKTAVVEGFALRVAAGQVPPALRDVVVRALDLGLLQAGAGVKGEFEDRLRGVVDEVKASAQAVILFIDEAHTLIGAGGPEGQGDAANLLKPALARGELRTIAATTWSEYKRYVEKDPALARRFQVVKVDEPDEDTAVEMLRGLVPLLEAHHGVRVLDEAVRDAVKLSHRYIPGRRLPDKAVSVLDTACARVALGRGGVPPRVEAVLRRVEALELEAAALAREAAAGADHAARLAELDAALDRARGERAELEDRWRAELERVNAIDALRARLEDGSGDASAAQGADRERRELRSLEADLEGVQGEDPLVPLVVSSRAAAAVISGWTGIPAGKILKDEIRAVLGLRQTLAERVVGQPRALDAIARRIRTYRASLDDPGKPVGVFLLVGPSGVGKTETALAVADHLYGGERNLVTVNMSEYQEAHTVSGLKGAPPGYVGYGTGGVLTEAVRRRPYCVVLLDEVEKAHPDVLELFYQVFDKGTLEDGEGIPVDFRNTAIFLTSNVGDEEIAAAGRGPGAGLDAEELAARVRPALLQRFRPAFLARLTVVPFLQLGDAQIREIVELKLADVQRRFWEAHRADLTYDEAVVGQVADRCREVDSGARNVDHILSQAVLPELSARVLEHMARGLPVPSVHLAVDAAGAFEFLLTRAEAAA